MIPSTTNQQTNMLRTKRQFRTNLCTRAMAAALALSPALALADGTDISSTLSTAATTAITALVAVVGTILVACFAVPVGKATYRVIKSCLPS